MEGKVKERSVAERKKEQWSVGGSMYVRGSLTTLVCFVTFPHYEGAK